MLVWKLRCYVPFWTDFALSAGVFFRAGFFLVVLGTGTELSTIERLASLGKVSHLPSEAAIYDVVRFGCRAKFLLSLGASIEDWPSETILYWSLAIFELGSFIFAYLALVCLAVTGPLAAFDLAAALDYALASCFGLFFTVFYCCYSFLSLWSHF